jgi:transposase
LRRVWAAQYTDPPRPLRWRAVQERLPAAVVSTSPSEGEARDGTKRDSAWVGDTVHRTEACEAEQPHRITGGMTAPATPPAGVLGPALQPDLAQRDRLPGTHLLDGGYVDAG